MRSFALVILGSFLAAAGFAQQVQTSDVTNTQPLYSVNAKYVEGVGPGYWPTAGSGLTLNIAGGTVWCAGTVRTYAAGTLGMTNNTTNYVYLDPTASCAPAVSTSVFTAAQIPIAIVVTSSGAITAITDDRTWFDSLNFSSLGTLGCSQMPALTGDVTSSAGSCATTDVKVDGVSYPADTSTNTVPVKTSAGAVTYEQLPNAALANSSTTVNGQTCALGSSCNANAGAATHSIALNEGNGNAQTGLALGVHQVAIGASGADPSAKTIPDCQDTSGNHLNFTQSSDSFACGTSSSGGGGTAALTQPYANDTSTGTTLNRVAQLKTNTSSTAIVCCTANSGNYFPAGSPYVGICTAGCGTSGSATITYQGVAGCVFENNVTANDAVAIWSDGRCADIGFPPPNSEANSRQLPIGIAVASGSAGATVNVSLQTIAPLRIGGVGWPSFLVQAPGSPVQQFAGPLLLNYPTFGSVDPASAGVAVNQFSCLQFLNSSSVTSQYSEITGGNGGCDIGGYSGLNGGDLVIDPRTHNNANASLMFNAAARSQPEVSNWSGNKSNTNLSISNTRIWTLTGNGFMGGSLQNEQIGSVFNWQVCQDGTGGRQYVFDPTMGWGGFVPAAANACMSQIFMARDTSGTANVSTQAIAPAIPISVTKSGQTSSISATAINAIRNNVSGAYNILTPLGRICAAIYTTTAGSAGTVSASVSYTDPAGNSVTDTLISSVSLTSTTNHSGNCIMVVAKDSSSVTYSTTVSGASGSPQYMLKLSMEKMSPEMN